MKTTKERNPYLLRNAIDAPHKYSFEMQTGNFLLLAQDGSQTTISKIGTFRPKFRKNFTGFVTPKERYEAAKLDKTALHYAPDLTFRKEDSYYTPVTRKFIGYAQQPYKIKGRNISAHLANPDHSHKFKNSAPSLKKSHSQHKEDKIVNKESLILNHSATTFMAKNTDDRFFETSYSAMTNSKLLPKKPKPTCYNYRCKNLQHFTFDEKAKTMASTRFTNTRSHMDNTLSKTFYDQKFKEQRQQLLMLQ